MKKHSGSNCLRVRIRYACKVCGLGVFCDVCHEHDEPRGECRKCGPCPRCEAETKGKRAARAAKGGGK